MLRDVRQVGPTEGRGSTRRTHVRSYAWCRDVVVVRWCTRFSVLLIRFEVRGLPRGGVCTSPRAHRGRQLSPGDQPPHRPWAVVSPSARTVACICTPMECTEVHVSGFVLTKTRSCAESRASTAFLYRRKRVQTPAASREGARAPDPPATCGAHQATTGDLGSARGSSSCSGGIHTTNTVYVSDVQSGTQCPSPRKGDTHVRDPPRPRHVLE